MLHLQVLPGVHQAADDEEAAAGGVFSLEEVRALLAVPQEDLYADRLPGVPGHVTVRVAHQEQQQRQGH